jgi:hypothetical protein
VYNGRIDTGSEFIGTLFWLRWKRSTIPTLYMVWEKEWAKVMSVTKSVNFPVNDGTEVVMSEQTAELLAGICKKVKAVKSRKDGVVVRHLYVPDWVAMEHGLNQHIPLWQFVVMQDALHRKLDGDGRIYHDGSESFLPENFRRDEWPETDDSVLPKEQKQVAVKMGQTLESVRAQQREWLDDAVLYETAFRQTNRSADVVDAVQSAYEAALKQIDAGRCKAQTKAELCGYVLATCRNKFFEMVRHNVEHRKTHSRMTENFEDGEQHHVRRTAPKPRQDDISPKFDSAFGARS